MNIQKIPISKEKLEAIPEAERVFFVLLGHFLNEISILNKLLLFANVRRGSDVEHKAHSAQALFIARLFIGKVIEGWKMLTRDFFGSILSKQYEPKLQPPGDVALTNLKRYFAKRNLLQDIRNNFSFHYSSDRVKEQWRLLNPSFSSELYLADDYANSLNWACEEIVSYAMLGVAEAKDPQEALETIIGDLTKVSGWFFDFCGSCMAVTVELHLGANLRELNAEQIDVGEPIPYETVTLPYFVRMPRSASSQ